MPKEKKEITKEVIEYVITPATIEAMKKQYSGMKITDAASDKAVRAARTFMVSQRTSVEKWRIEQNEEANDWRRRINQRAKEITAFLLPIEEPLQIEVKRVDDEKAKEKAKKEAQEQARKDGIQEKIHEIRMATGGINLMDLKSLEEISEGLVDINIGDTEYMEFAEDAEKALDASYDAVQSAIAARIKLDKEAEERKAEGERLEKARKKLKADQALIDERNKTFEDSKEWFKKNIKGDSFQIPSISETENAINELQSAIKVAQEPGLELLIKEQIEEAHGILAFRIDQAKLAKAQKKIDDEKDQLEEKKKQEAFEKAATQKAEAAAAQKVKDDAKEKEAKERVEEVEKERKAAMAPDREKLYTFTNQFDEHNLDIPKLYADEAQEILKNALEELFILGNNVRRKADSLFIVDKAQEL